MTVRVAIIGSGPSGFYTADALLRSGADVEISVIDRLPTPFGLIRAGVAPDQRISSWYSAHIPLRRRRACCTRWHI